MVAHGLAARKGAYLKVFGIDGKDDKTKKKSKNQAKKITEADVKVLDFRIQGNPCAVLSIFGLLFSFSPVVVGYFHPSQ